MQKCLDKVIFLDIDGVLSLIGTPSKSTSLNKKRLHNLQRIVNETDCKIILSSTWRLYPDYVARLKRCLSYRGMIISGFTPNYIEQFGNSGYLRGIEIFDWTRINKPNQYAIIDDNNEFFEFQYPNLFLTDERQGLTEEITNNIILHFNGLIK